MLHTTSSAVSRTTPLLVMPATTVVGCVSKVRSSEGGGRGVGKAVQLVAGLLLP